MIKRKFQFVGILFKALRNKGKNRLVNELLSEIRLTILQKNNINEEALEEKWIKLIIKLLELNQKESSLNWKFNDNF